MVLERMGPFKMIRVPSHLGFIKSSVSDDYERGPSALGIWVILESHLEAVLPEYRFCPREFPAIVANKRGWFSAQYGLALAHGSASTA